MKPEFEYQGTELALFATAVNWRSYWTSLVDPYLCGEVLEVGAGLGSVTKRLHARACVWHAMEPDPHMAASISDWVVGDHADNVKVHCGTLADLPATPAFDVVLYADVLEHIQEDAQELASAIARLRAGGHLVVLVPAHQALFSPFDARIGHFRRYSLASIRAIAPVGGREVFAGYLDAIGLAASVTNRFVLRSGEPTPKQVGLWDRLMVPMSRRVDPLIRHRLGKSVMVVWEKQAASVRRLDTQP